MRPSGTCKEIMHSTGRMPDMMGVFWCLVGFLWLKAVVYDCVGVLVCIDHGRNIDFFFFFFAAYAMLLNHGYRM